MSTPAISIIVPTLNEADNILPLLRRIDASMQAATLSYEVIFIDDHSTDRTLATIRSAQRRYPIHYQTKIGRRGKSYSLQQGFQLARYDLVCMIDADLQYPPEAIGTMAGLIAVHNVDIVLTERLAHQTSFMRRASSRIFNFFFVNLLFGFRYDTQSGLKVFKKEVLKGITFHGKAWSFDLEFIVQALENDFRIKSYAIPFSARTSGEAKLKLLDSTYELIVESVKLRFKSSGKQLRQAYRANSEPLIKSPGL